MTKPIGLVVKTEIPEALALANEVLEWAKKEGRECLVEEISQAALKRNGPSCLCPELASKADPIVTLGGDGTLIGVARYVDKDAPTFIGVKFGHLGFLTEIAPAELLTILSDVLQGKAKLGHRSLISATVTRGKTISFSSQAANDAVISKGATDPLVDLDLAVNGEEVMRLRADGLIVSTPTGSTAYSLAAGGSIAHPSLEAVLVTPICPFSLSNRPLILPGEFTISTAIPQYPGSVFLSIDGQVSFPLRVGDKVAITKSPNKINVALSPSRSYFQILRRKLNWGIANNND